MREIGGYIEYEQYHGKMLHEEAIALNCGRNCLVYLFKSRGIKRLKVPYFMCDSIFDVCDREGVEKSFYHIDSSFRPTDELVIEDDEWLYLANLYGQLDDDSIGEYVKRYKRVVLDQAHAYFADPYPGIDSMYTSRKWFGVADGAFLYTTSTLDEELPQDESMNRMGFLMGRFERTASEFYEGFNENNLYFVEEPVKRMSKLTANLLRGIDYDRIERQRERNYNYLHEKLASFNQLTLKPATFMYPFMVDDGDKLRKLLQKEHIYIPTLWPSVFDVAEPDSLECNMAANILPLPVDQRYDVDDMDYMVTKILELMENL